MTEKCFKFVKKGKVLKRAALFFLLLFSNLLFSQDESPQELEARSFLYTSVHIIPGDSLNNVYYTYRLPYNRLVFEKNNNRYYAGFNLAVEVFDSLNNFVVRTFSGSEIETDKFEKTDSGTDYYEGMNSFSIRHGEYNVIPIFTDIKSGREIKLRPVKIVTSLYDSSKILSPLVTDANSNNEIQLLTNFEDNIPFTSSDYNLIVPVRDTTIKQLYVNIIEDKDTLFKKTVTESFLSSLVLDTTGGRIAIKRGKEEITKNFIVSNFSRNLLPGNIIINISSSAGKKPDKTYQKSVIWFNRPKALVNPEYAIKILKYTTPDSVISKLLNEDKEKYPKVLFSFWKKYDPTPGTAFNELMAEYYERADYADINFTPITGKSGIESDRGKIFILFGRPQSIQRNSNEFGKIVETWVYENPGRKFIFVDQRGTGDFSLING